MTGYEQVLHAFQTEGDGGIAMNPEHSKEALDAWLNHERAEVLRNFANRVYNGAPASRDANFQAFYNEGLHPVLMAEADRIEFGLEWEE